MEANKNGAIIRGRSELVLPLDKSTVKSLMIFLGLLTLFNGLILYGSYFNPSSLNGTHQIVDEWKFSQFLVNYESEFVKRAVVGSFLSALPGEITDHSIALYSFGVANAFFVLFLLFARKCFQANKSHFLGFMLIFTFSPAIAMQFGEELGRLDQSNLLIALLTLILLLGAQPKSHYQAMLKTGLIATLLIAGLLIHEGFLFYGAPLLLALCYQRAAAGSLPNYAPPVCILAVIATSCVIIQFGSVTPDIVAQWTTSYDQLFPGYDPGRSLEVWERSPGYLILTSVSSLLNLYYIELLIPALVIALLYSLLLLRLIDFSKLDKHYWPILASPFAIAPLFVLGWDFRRWVALYIVTLFFLFLALLRDDKIRLPESSFLKPQFIIPIIAAGLWYGPIGT